MPQEYITKKIGEKMITGSSFNRSNPTYTLLNCKARYVEWPIYSKSKCQSNFNSQHFTELNKKSTHRKAISYENHENDIILELQNSIAWRIFRE